MRLYLRSKDCVVSKLSSKNWILWAHLKESTSSSQIATFFSWLPELKCCLTAKKSEINSRKVLRSSLTPWKLFSVSLVFWTLFANNFIHFHSLQFKLFIQFLHGKFFSRSLSSQATDVEFVQELSARYFELYSKSIFKDVCALFQTSQRAGVFVSRVWLLCERLSSHARWSVHFEKSICRVQTNMGPMQSCSLDRELPVVSFSFNWKVFRKYHRNVFPIGGKSLQRLFI